MPYRVGVTDIGEVGGTGVAGVESGSGDRRAAIGGQCDTGVVDGRVGTERGARDEHDGK